MTVVVPSVSQPNGAAILEIIRRAAPKLGLDRPESVYGSPDETAQSLGEAANEAAETIIRYNDWSYLRREMTFVGDGATTAYGFPTDYMRMIKDARMWSTALQCPLTHVVAADDWVQLQVRQVQPIAASWTIMGAALHFYPALMLGETARAVYMSLDGIKTAGGQAKARFTADSDVFALGDQVIELGILALWRANRGLPYEAYLARFTGALERLAANDGGPGILRQRSRISMTGATQAYPRSITP